MITPLFSFGNEPVSESNERSNVENSHHQTDKQSKHTDTSPLFFIILAVIIGAATRFTFRKSVIPFTVILLILGIVIGVFGRLNYLDIYEIGNMKLDFSFLDQSIDWAANIDPHLMLYVFLPILIFEAAFAMDVHVLNIYIYILYIYVYAKCLICIYVEYIYIYIHLYPFGEYIYIYLYMLDIYIYICEYCSRASTLYCSPDAEACTCDAALY